MNENTNTIPTRKESGFDPMKYLRKAVSETGEPVLRLPLTYQKFWFRQSCPNGRMLLKPLRLTDQLAIFEAQVYLHRDDQTPAGSFTANKTAEETSGYIRAAQNEALSEALDNAGFGYQTQDTTVRPAGDNGRSVSASPIRTDGGTRNQPTPVTQKASAAPEHIQMVEPPAESAPVPRPVPAPEVTAAQNVAPSAVAEDNAAVGAAPASDPAPTAQSVIQQDSSAPVAENKPAQVEREEEPAQEQQEEPAAPEGQQSAVVTMLDFPTQGEKTDTPAGGAPEQVETQPQATPSYTEDMSVEEICQLMTLEEAREVVVTKGTCSGWTMAQVAEKRPSSLRFYTSGYGRVNNIQLAAATLLMQDIELKKAG